MNDQFLLIIIGVLAMLVIVAIILGIVNTSKLNSVLEYSEDGNLVDNLQKYYDSVRDIQKKLKVSHEGAMLERISSCETKVNMTLSKIGIINFDAFDDVHGKQSFSLAVLNQYNNGFVLTSLYGSSSSNTYVRPVREGKSTTVLIDEEKEAIAKAMSGNIEVTE